MTPIAGHDRSGAGQPAPSRTTELAAAAVSH
jgi:hypothetical protein